MRNDPNRLQKLRQLLILDTKPERAFDDITLLLSSSLEVPIAVINVLDERRDWFKACTGLPMSQSPAETSFCEVFFSTADDIVVVNDALLDPRFSSHPLVIGPPFIRFYAAARLIVDGTTVGTLCTYDFVAREVSMEQVSNLQALASAAIELISKRNDKT